jgi:hypothetical protein
MSSVNTYNYRNLAWEAQQPNFWQMAPSASDYKLVISSTCIAMPALDTTVQQVWWTSSGGGFMARFGGNAPTATCGMYFTAGASGVWSATMCACADFIRQGGTDASMFIVPLL